MAAGLCKLRNPDTSLLARFAGPFYRVAARRSTQYPLAAAANAAASPAYWSVGAARKSCTNFFNSPSPTSDTAQ